MNSRLLLSLLAGSFALVACGEPSSPDDMHDTPDAGVPEMPAAFDVTVATPKVPILTGTSVQVEVTVTRHAPFAGAVTVTFEGLPAGVSVESLTLDAGTTQGTATLTAMTGAPHSLPTEVTVAGTAGTDRASTTATVTVTGTPGSVDQSFAGGGTRLLNLSAGDDYAFATAVQPDGKILIAGRVPDHGGDFALVRLTRDGVLDTTFGDNGRVTTDFGGSDSAYAIALQADGKIVVAGSAALASSGIDFAVARYTTDGSPDVTFSGDGKLTTAFGNDTDTAFAIAIQPDGKLVVAGESNRGSSATGMDFALARYQPDGSLDASFGGTGTVTTAIGGNSARDVVFALGLQDVGGELRIVAAGGDGDFRIARFRSTGAVDTSFGTNGLINGIYQSVSGSANAIAVAPSGALFVAGHADNKFAVVELTPSGAVDATFGRVVIPINPTNSNAAQAIVLDGDRPLVAGWANETINGQNTSSGNFALVRLRPDGELDTTFGSGIVVTPVAAASKPDKAMAITLQVDDRVPTVRAVVAGTASASNNDFAVARYWR
jgi:uncharacterized delta-60 repeat protein